MLAEDRIVGDRQIKLISSPNSGNPAHMGLAVRLSHKERGDSEVEH